MGVSVPRDANGDADRLSHPNRLGEVREEAKEAGWRVSVASIPQHCWEALREAIIADGGAGATAAARPG
eukprot:5555687-Pleurochrysis_carterae.AAC.1